MVNCNPETVSTDYDTSDRLYFEPLTPEDVLEIIDTERTNGTLHGVIVQFGGQTPLKLAEPLEKAKVPILGTSPDMIDLAEDRDRFKKLLDKLKVRQPQNGIATSPGAARAIADEIGYPVVIRPSYVLGGRAMEIVRDARPARPLRGAARRRSRPAERTGGVEKKPAADRPLSLRRHRSRRRLPRRRQGHLHRRHHGAHRGSRHPFRRFGLRAAAAFARARRRIAELERQTRALALALNVGGLMNVQYAIKDGDIYVLEVNPRASRTVPFVAKVIGLPVAKIAARIMAGESLASFKLVPSHLQAPRGEGSGVPVRALPRRRHRARAGDEIDRRGDGHRRLASRSPSPRARSAAAPICRAPAPCSSRSRTPTSRAFWPRCKLLASLGFKTIATSGTQRYLAEQGVAAAKINKVLEGRPHIVDAIKNGGVQLVFNTTEGATALADSRSLRHAALLHKVPYYTTLSGAVAAAQGIKAYLGGDLEVRTLQSYFSDRA